MYGRGPGRMQKSCVISASLSTRTARELPTYRMYVRKYVGSALYRFVVGLSEQAADPAWFVGCSFPGDRFIDKDPQAPFIMSASALGKCRVPRLKTTTTALIILSFHVRLMTHAL